MSAPESVRREILEEGQVWRVVLDAPKANIVDAAMTARLGLIFEQAAAASSLKAILLEGEGKHFSFGASVAEHTPAEVGRMLPTFHAMFLELAASNRVL